MNDFEFNKFNPIQAVREEITNKLLDEYRFLNKNIIGRSLCNRDLTCLSLGNKNNIVLLSAAFHGMEWLTTLLLLKFVNKMCEYIKSNKKFCGINLAECFKKRGVTILPCMNPDGVEISLTGARAACRYEELVKKIDQTSIWQANARGVDLNHNYNAGWQELHKLEQENGFCGPSHTRYGGPTPESEPETKALTKFCREHFINHALAFHSQGEEIFWHYGKNTPPEAESIAKAFAIASGYEMSQPEGLAVGGGFKDWFIEEFKRPAFTIEIGIGKNPLPLEDLDGIYNKLEKMLFISVLI